MPTITLRHSMLKRIQEINGAIHNKNDLSDLLPKMGCPVELNDDDDIEIEAVSYTHLTLPTNREV